MALTKKNIIIGAAQVWLGPSVSATADLATSKPAYVALTRYTATLNTANTPYNSAAAASSTTAWAEVGYTQDGLEVATDPSWGEVEVDQLLDSAKIFKDGMSLNISTTFAEATLENLLIAWGQAASTLTSSGLTGGDREVVIEGGSLGEAPLERGLIAVGNGVENPGATVNTYSERVYQFYRVLSVDPVTITNSRSDPSTIPVTFRALPADNGRYGSARERFNVV